MMENNKIIIIFKYMKKIICLFILLMLSNSSFAAQIQQGGVSFNVNSAREYVQEGQQDTADISGPYKFEINNVERVIYSRNNSGELVGITVQYINDPYRDYIYNKNKELIAMDVYDRPINVYPHRGYRYNLEGKLILTSLTVSKNEMFRFDPDGSLIAHSVNGIIYDENGRIIGNGK